MGLGLDLLVLTRWLGDERCVNVLAIFLCGKLVCVTILQEKENKDEYKYKVQIDDEGERKYAIDDFGECLEK